MVNIQLTLSAETIPAGPSDSTYGTINRASETNADSEMAYDMFQESRSKATEQLNTVLCRAKLEHDLKHIKKELNSLRETYRLQMDQLQSNAKKLTPSNLDQHPLRTTHGDDMALQKQTQCLRALDVCYEEASRVLDRMAKLRRERKELLRQLSFLQNQQCEN